MRYPLLRLTSSIAVLAGALTLLSTDGQAQMSHVAPSGGRPAAPPPIRASMSELHAHGGVPSGWKFLMPAGDATEGRKVFVTMECFACHEVKGERFPDSAKTPRGTG